VRRLLVPVCAAAVVLAAGVAPVSASEPLQDANVTRLSL